MGCARVVFRFRNGSLYPIIARIDGHGFAISSVFARCIRERSRTEFRRSGRFVSRFAVSPARNGYTRDFVGRLSDSYRNFGFGGIAMRSVADYFVIYFVILS